MNRPGATLVVPRTNGFSWSVTAAREAVPGEKRDFPIRGKAIWLELKSIRIFARLRRDKNDPWKGFRRLEAEPGAVLPFDGAGMSHRKA